MDQNPYQSPGDHEEGEPKQTEHSRILRIVFWHLVIFFSASIFLLYAYDNESWLMRIASGFAVAVAVWSFAELGRIGYGKESTDEAED